MRPRVVVEADELAEEARGVHVAEHVEEVTNVRLRTRTELVGHFDGMPKARLLIESCTLARWISRDLTRLGHEVCVAAPNFLPMYVDHASKRKKTDKRDASLLSLALQKGNWRQHDVDAARLVRLVASSRSAGWPRRRR